MNMIGTRWKWSCAVSEGNIYVNGTEKGLEVACSMGTRAVSIELGVIA